MKDLTHIILYGVVPTNMKNTHKMEIVSEKGVSYFDTPKPVEYMAVF